MQAVNEILNCFISRNVILVTLQIASLINADFGLLFSNCLTKIKCLVTDMGILG